MLYNEQVVSDTTQSVGIYEGNQGKVLMNQGKELKSEAERELKQAEQIEEKAHKLNLSQGMNELANNDQLMNNPQALGTELDKLAKGIAANIKNEEMRVNILTDYELAKGSYLNKATANMKRIQNENARAATYDSVYNNIESLGTAFSNGISGIYDDNDIVNYQYSLASLRDNINARNLDGTFMFTDAQRRAMAKDADTALIGGFVESYSKMEPKQRSEVADAIKNGSYVIRTSKGGSVGLEDIVGEKAYTDIKRNMDRYEAAVRFQEKKEEKARREQALDDFANNPTENGLDYLLSTYSFTKNKKAELQEILDNAPNYDAVTTFKDATELDDSFESFINSEFATSEEAMDKAISLIYKAGRSQNKGNFELGDFSAYKNKILTALRDEQVRTAMQELSGYRRSFKEATFDILSGNKRNTDYTRGVAEKNIERNSMLAMHAFDALVMDGKPEEAKKLLDSFRKKNIILATPELAGKEIGDRFTKNGIVWEVTGENSFKRAVTGKNTF